MPREDAVVVTLTVCPPQHLQKKLSGWLMQTGGLSGVILIDRSIDPLAMYWPVASKRVANTSPEWPKLR